MSWAQPEHPHPPMGFGKEGSAAALYHPQHFPQPQRCAIYNTTIILLISCPGLLETSLNPVFLLTTNPKIAFWPSPAPTDEKFPHHPAKTHRKRSTNSPFGQTRRHPDSRSGHCAARAAVAPPGCKSRANQFSCTHAKPQHFPPKINCPSTNILQTKVPCYSQRCSDAWQDLNANPGQRGRSTDRSRGGTVKLRRGRSSPPSPTCKQKTATGEQLASPARFYHT